MTREEWATRSLDEACRRIAESGAGDRHRMVYRGAAQVAPYVAAGVLARSSTDARLIDAAFASGVSEGRRSELARAIADAMRDKADETPWYPSSCGGGEHNRKRTMRFRGKLIELAAGQRASEAIPDWAAGSPLPTCDDTGDGRIWITIFSDDQSPQGKGSFWTWQDNVNAISDPEPWPAEGKSGLPLWAPVEYEGDSRARRGDRPCGVKRCHALVLDYDDDPSWSLEQVHRWWGDVRYFAHTSGSHLREKKTAPAMPRGRVVVALSRPVTEEEYTELAAWVLACGRGLPGEVELKNVRRAYYVAADAPGGYEHAAHDPGKVLDVDAILRAAVDLEQTSEDLSADSGVWARLTLKGDGTPKPTAKSLELILLDDPRWRGRIRLDEFAGRMMLDGRPWRDVDAAEIRSWAATVYQVEHGIEIIHQVAAMVASRNSYHPVRDYLNLLRWDGVPRLHLWLAEGLGCAADRASAAMGTRYLIAAVARVMQPGCKVDEMLVLKGPQGAGKSRALRALVPVDSWFSDTTLPIGEKDAFQQLRGVLIYEIAEMDSIRRSEWTGVKAFLSSQVDTYRASYGRVQEAIPRQTVFAGSTNEAAFLGDSTGQRRFWVREVGTCRPEWIVASRDQLWAEAIDLWRQGEQWHLTPSEAALAAAAAEAYVQVDPWEESIRGYIVSRTSVTSREILQQLFEIDHADLNKGHEMRIAAILQGMGWVRHHTKAGKVWRPPVVVVAGDHR
jgi:hypothetical protein